MWWWICTAVAVAGASAFWVWIGRSTDLGHRSRAFEQSEPEIAAALREAQRARDAGRFFGHH